MEMKEFIYKEVESYLKSHMSANRFSVVAIVEDMPTFEGFIIPYYSQMIEGVPFPVDIEEPYINSEDYEEQYSEIVTLLAYRLMRFGSNQELN
nr:MAG: hypothetical protein [Bacteriophage sp.]